MTKVGRGWYPDKPEDPIDEIFSKALRDKLKEVFDLHKQRKKELLDAIEKVKE